MKTLANIARRFHEEESGAAMIEYTILLGIITVAVIALVGAVGVWVSGQWQTLCTKVTGAACATT